ncbi:non-ribosomal peptide synthetase [Streptomyces flavofungini]|uniref:Amino acid adenylation domain-containing protein n=1 Tax=Streptomyces flavofungini TaxID=68200 RepID=A0ABS0XDD2_9ACTN|nr:non-ribosomal peptide synthetase [Streptomyces flavofungini]MBJ3811228.1 amino acid adenylation domain-containing protein [Streptomyces flavofungini]GHC66683.1 hypothetical protein GCM10010349_39510 [Streptomyces flavofungini]
MNHALSPVTAEWPMVLLPTDRRRQAGVPTRSPATARAELRVPPTQDVLLAGFAALLFRYTGEDQISFDRTDADGRTEQVRLLGVGESTLDELAHRWTADLLPQAGPASTGIRFAAPGDAAASLAHELQLVVREDTEGRHALELHYDGGLFDATTAARLLDHYRTLVEDGTAHPDRPVARLRLLTGVELRRMLVEWNQTGTDLPNDVCLHAAFEIQADRAPDAVAVVRGTERRTYGQINREANRLAHRLIALGVGPDVRVGLCLDRSPELLVAVLGILKAGGSYVPLDPEYPGQRIATMVHGTSCAVMVSRSDLTANLPGTSPEESRPLVLLDRDADALAAQPEHNPGPTSGPDDLCYILHSSGSTGAPKPIALRHRGVMNTLADLNSRFGVGPGDAVLSLSSPSFDLSVYEFLGLTTAGGTVVLPDPARTKDPAHWAELIVAENLTIWHSAPALLTLLTDHLEQTGAAPIPGLRLSMLGGDWVPVTLCDRLRVFAPELRFIVMGGATEASIHSTIYDVEVTDPEWASIPYGRPLANQRAYILDDALQPVAPGVTGELCVAGVSLAREYLGQPERTAERFLDWSHADVAGERIYRTGDMARFAPDGMIEMLGRRDFQVKVNGLRVELGEIEVVLRAHEGIRQTAVVARDGRLIAYVVPGEDQEVPAASKLRDFLAERLPEFMVPKAFVVLDKLPITPNGKLDRKGLPEPGFAGATYRAPRSAEEETLAGVFAEVLGRERVGIDDDFVGMGGDSIRSIQVVIRARARGIEITTRQIFESRTIAELALAATTADPTTYAAEDTSEPMLTADRDDVDSWTRRYGQLADVWPLTPMQSGMLFESMLSDTGPDTYQMQTLYHLSGRVDAARLRAAGQAVLERHPNLRAAFVTDSTDNLVQVIVNGVELPWREIDLSDLPEAARDEELRRFLGEDRAARFDRAEPPLLRMALVRLGPERAELVLTTHHVLLDGWSEQVLAQDLLRLYAAADPSALEPARGFRDFLAWLSRQDHEESSRAWAAELAGLDGPTTLVPGEAQPAAVGDVSVTLTPDESRQWARCCAELGVTAGTLVHGAWALVLSALTGRQDVVFGSTVAGRPSTLAGVESMVGIFINTLPVRVRCTPGGTVTELLTDLQKRQTALLDHHHHSLAEIQRATGLAALFDTLVVIQSYPPRDDGSAVEAGVEITGVDSAAAVNYPLTLIAEGDRFTVQYHADLVDKGTAEAVAARFHSVLNQLAGDAGRRVGTVDVLLPGERDQLLAAPAGAPSVSQDTPVTLFEHRAAATPEAIAVADAAAELTYRELDVRADRLAAELVGRGAGPETVVALALPRSVGLAVALVGTAKSGAAFLPVDPARQDVAGADLVLTLADLDLPEPTGTGGSRPAAPDPRHLACVRGPGGSSGGIALSHRALADAVRRFAAGAGLLPGTRLLAASPHEDEVAFEILAALCAGARVEVTPHAADLIQDGWAGDVISTSAPFFAEALDRCAKTVRTNTVALTGDVLGGSFADRIRDRIPGVRTVDVYRPAGTAGGAPLDTTKAYVLSPALRPVPPGVTGELYLAGEVPRGYHADGAPTAQRLVADPYGPAGSRMHRTGDLARWDGAGRVEFAGHGGARATIDGHQVRTGDVEAVLAAHPAVSRTVVAVREGDRLVGYVVPAPGGGADGEELREYVARLLPAHMVPAVIVTLDELPSGASADLEALPDPGAAAADGGGYRGGRTSQEEALCELFADVLGLDRVGIDDDFFKLGGNSLLATRLIGRLRRSLGVEVSIRTIFEHPTIARLSGHIPAEPKKSRPRLRRMTQ